MTSSHFTSLRECLRELGYEPKSISEGLAVVYGELGDSNFTGIGVSCGGDFRKEGRGCEK